MPRPGLLLLLALGALLIRPLPAGGAPAPIDPRTAGRFGALWVQSPQGRFEPVNTYSSELLRKICHRDHLDTLDSDRALLHWLADPHYWQRQPIVYLPDKALQQRFGVQGRYAAYADFFDREGRYSLADEVEAAYAAPPAGRSKSEKELIKLDERINILHALFAGRMLPLLPAASGEGWVSPGDMPPADDSLATQGRAVLAALGQALREGRTAQADRMIERIAELQAQATGVQLDQRRKSAELLYNRAGFFRWAFRAYLAAGFILLVFACLPGRAARRGAMLLGFAVAGIFLWHSAGIALRGYISARAPWSNAYETMVYVAWATVLAGLILGRRSPVVLALGALMGGVVLFVSNLNWLDPQITPLAPVLRSPWLMIHVSVITASYGFFGLGALCGIGTLVGLALGRRNPTLHIVNELSLWIGLVLLTAGIFFGAVWANESWGRYWGWDPKETWALITMLYYAIALHARHIRGLGTDYAFSLFSIGGIYMVMMTFFGVNYLLSGLHSYGHSGGISLWPIGAATLLLLLLALVAGWRIRRAR